MKKICIINQPQGLGDILYLQKIGYHYQDQGYEIYWPICDFYSSYISDYIKNFKYFPDSLDGYIKIGLNEKIHRLVHENPGQFGKIYDGIVGDINLKIVPTNHLPNIQAANPEIMPNPGTIQKRKYSFVGVPDSDWPDYLHINRNTDKENDLYHNVLKIKDGEDYALVNTFLGTPPHFVSEFNFILDNFLKSSSGKKGLRYISVEFLDQFTLFDWMKVIENAKEIWMEGSSITWICEKLKLKAEKLVLYQRNGSFNSEMHNLFSHPWSEHGVDVDSLVNIPLRNKSEKNNII